MEKYTCTPVHVQLTDNIQPFIIHDLQNIQSHSVPSQYLHISHQKFAAGHTTQTKGTILPTKSSVRNSPSFRLCILYQPTMHYNKNDNLAVIILYIPTCSPQCVCTFASRLKRNCLQDIEQNGVCAVMYPFTFIACIK